MFRTKQQVDKQVASILSRSQDPREQQTRGYQFAKLYFDVKDFQSAKQHLEMYLKANPDSAQAHSLRAQIAEAMKDDSTALAAYRQAFELDRGQKSLLLSICSVLTRQAAAGGLTDSESARMWVERAEASFPSSPVVLSLKARLLVLTGDAASVGGSSSPSASAAAAAAVDLLTAEVAKSPRDANRRIQLIDQLSKLGRLNEAYKCCLDAEAAGWHFDSIDWYRRYASLLADIARINESPSAAAAATDASKLASQRLHCQRRLVWLCCASSASVPELANQLGKLDSMLQQLAGTVSEACLADMDAELFALAGFLLCKRASVRLLTADTARRPLIYLMQAAFTDTDASIPNLPNYSALRRSIAGHMVAAMTSSSSSTSASLAESVATYAESSSARRGGIAELVYSDVKLSDLIARSRLAESLLHRSVSLSAPDREQQLKLDAEGCSASGNWTDLNQLAWCLDRWRSPASIRSLVLAGFPRLRDSLAVSSEDLTSPESLCRADIQLFLSAVCILSQDLASPQQQQQHQLPVPPMLPWSRRWSGYDDCVTFWRAAVCLGAPNNSSSSSSSYQLDARQRRSLSLGLEALRNCLMPLRLLARLAEFWTPTSLNDKKESSAESDIAGRLWERVVQIVRSDGGGSAIGSRPAAMFDIGGGAGGVTACTRTELDDWLARGLSFRAAVAEEAGDVDSALELYSEMRTAEGAYRAGKLLLTVASEPSRPSTDQRALLVKSRDKLREALDRTWNSQAHPLHAEICASLEEVEDRLDAASASQSMLTNGVASQHPQHHQPPPHIPPQLSTPFTPATNYRSYQTRLTPDRVDSVVRSISAANDKVVSQLVEQNRQLMEQNKQLMSTNQELIRMMGQQRQEATRIEQLERCIAEMKLQQQQQQQQQQQHLHTVQHPPPPPIAMHQQHPLPPPQFFLQGSNATAAAAAAAAAAAYHQIGVLRPSLAQPHPPAAAAPPLMVGRTPTGAIKEVAYDDDDEEAGDMDEVGAEVYKQQQQQPQLPPASAGFFSIGGSLFGQPPAAALQPPRPQQAAPFTLAARPGLLPTPPVFGAPRQPPLQPPPPQLQQSSTPKPLMAPSQLVVKPVPTAAFPGVNAAAAPAAAPAAPAFSSGESAGKGSASKQENPLASLISKSQQPSVSTPSIQSPMQFGLSLNVKSSVVPAAAPESQSASAVDKDDSTDHPESFEPSIEFTPVVTLPDKVEIKTGEESDERLFAERAALYRFVGGEWKSRGIGELKILQSQANSKYRIVMRRDQVKKLCANHWIDASMKLKEVQNVANAVSWTANDFSDGEAKMEILCARFKTPEQLAEFTAKFAECQKALEAGKASDSNKQAASSASPAATTTATTSAASSGASSLMDRLKPPPGSWSCPTCAVQNTKDQAVCPCCSTAKPGGDKPGAAATPSTHTAPSSTTTAVSSSQPLFSFGGMTFGSSSSGTQAGKPSAPITTAASSAATTTTTAASAQPFSFGFSFGASAKPATTSTAAIGAAATSAKPSGPSPFTNFSFGMPAKTVATTTTAAAGPAVSTAAPFAGFGGLNFGGISFGSAKPSAAAGGPPSPAASAAASASASAAPAASASAADDSVDNPESFEPSVEFTPVVSLPDKVEIKTGEESDERLFAERAALYRFVGGEWKSRGIGELKILQSQANSKYRIVMRRDQVKKLCANHWIDASMKLKEVQNVANAVSWTANDFSDGEAKMEILCARFKTPEQLAEFTAKFAECQKALEAGKASDSNKQAASSASPAATTTATTSAASSGASSLMDRLKPPPGSWSCPTCAVQNTKDQAVCPCCSTAKPGGDKPGAAATPSTHTAPSSTTTAVSSSQPLFSFGGMTFGSSSSGTQAGKPSTTANSTTTSATTASASPFSFGFSSGASATSAASNASVKFGFGFGASSSSSTAQASKLASSDTNTAAAEASTKDKDSNSDEVVFVKFDPPVTDEQISRARRLKLPDYFYAYENRSGQDGHESDGEGAYSATRQEQPQQTEPKPAEQAQKQQEPVSMGIFGEKANSMFSFASLATTATSNPQAAPAANSASFSWSGAGSVLFGGSSKQQQQQQQQSKLNEAADEADDNNEDEEEHDPHYEPVIDLPELVTVKSGEEDEQSLFCQRARLYRWTDGQWKERGVGQMKVLQRRDGGACRLVMRRDQVHKLCCNHRLSSGLQFKPMPNSATSVCWFCVDFSDESTPEGRNEQFAIKFKSKDELDEFFKVCAGCTSGAAATPEKN